MVAAGVQFAVGVHLCSLGSERFCKVCMSAEALPSARKFVTFEGENTSRLSVADCAAAALIACKRGLLRKLADPEAAHMRCWVLDFNRAHLEAWSARSRC